eukprot:6487154-Amphidinium_carterae.1
MNSTPTLHTCTRQFICRTHRRHCVSNMSQPVVSRNSHPITLSPSACPSATPHTEPRPEANLYDLITQ